VIGLLVTNDFILQTSEPSR